jgi:hypothetical protein
MLVQFVVENFLSFASEQVISLAPAEAKGQPLRCAAVYGPNAAGKSNLVRALGVAQRLVAGTRRDEPLPFQPFGGGAGPEGKTRFQFHLELEGEHLEYGFVFDRESIAQEWLVQLLDGKEEILFQRTDAAQGPKVKLSGKLGKKDSKHADFLRFVAQGTRRNQLFLAECGDRNVPDFQPLLDWFRRGLVVVAGASATPPAFASRVETDEPFRAFLSAMLRGAGTGVQEVFAERRPAPAQTGGRAVPIYVGPLPADHDPSSHAEARAEPPVPGSGLPPAHEMYFRFRLPKNAQGEVIELKTRHRLGQQEVTFSLDQESDGTQRLLYLAALLHDDGAGRGRTVVVDELERSLHPLLTRALIRALREHQGALGSQLLFTTHDTNLLDQRLLPIDAVWFVERDGEGQSRLFPLTDFDPGQLEKLGPDLERGYLAGRFGAVPPQSPISFARKASQSQEIEGKTRPPGKQAGAKTARKGGRR